MSNKVYEFIKGRNINTAQGGLDTDIITNAVRILQDKILCEDGENKMEVAVGNYFIGKLELAKTIEREKVMYAHFLDQFRIEGTDDIEIKLKETSCVTKLSEVFKKEEIFENTMGKIRFKEDKNKPLEICPIPVPEEDKENKLFNLLFCCYKEQLYYLGDYIDLTPYKISNMLTEYISLLKSFIQNKKKISKVKELFEDKFRRENVKATMEEIVSYSNTKIKGYEKILELAIERLEPKINFLKECEKDVLINPLERAGVTPGVYKIR